MNIAFFGLGIMGAPMSRNLLAAGHTLFLADRPSIPQSIRDVATIFRTPAEAVAKAEVIIVMLPDTLDVEALLRGANGILAALPVGALLIDMSSISPTSTVSFASDVEAAGCDWLDAPVSGGELAATSASLTIMAGGSDWAFERASPLLKLMGKNITHVGAAGAGQICKVANQMIVAANILAVAEALTFATKAGANPAVVREALMGGFAASRVLEVHGKRMIDRTFKPGFRIGLHQKDLNLALSSARSLDMALPGTALAQQIFSVCAAQGHSESDHSAVVTAIELMAGLG
jgi:2-hydroxy-3-oxopropionate reductase